MLFPALFLSLSVPIFGSIGRSTRIAGPAGTEKTSPREPGSKMVKGPPGSDWRVMVETVEGDLWLSGAVTFKM